jgi:hypothetical protein
MFANSSTDPPRFASVVFLFFFAHIFSLAALTACRALIADIVSSIIERIELVTPAVRERFGQIRIEDDGVHGTKP